MFIYLCKGMDHMGSVLYGYACYDESCISGAFEKVEIKCCNDQDNCNSELDIFFESNLKSRALILNQAGLLFCTIKVLLIYFVISQSSNFV